MNMKKKAIVFISDIHFSVEGKDSQFKNNDDTYNRTWFNYLDRVIENDEIDIKYLVVAGDVADRARKKEYLEVENILNSFCGHFKVDKKNVLIIPGNHDINRAELSSYCDKNDIDGKDAYKQHKIKLDNYSVFFKRFKGVENFDPEASILDSITIEELNLLILGINSQVKETYLEDGNAHYGFVDISILENEIPKYTEEGREIFIVTHHSMSDTHGNELRTIENARVLRESLVQFGINTYFYGHHHISEAKTIIKGDECTTYIEIGTIGKIINNKDGSCYTNRFSIGVCGENSIEIKDYAYTGGEWEHRDNKKFENTIIVRKDIRDKEEINEQVQPLPIAESNPAPKMAEEPITDENNVIIYNNSSFLLKHLQKAGNYREGHFHWKDTKKTLGWINVAAFLGDIEILSQIKDCVKDIYDKEINDCEAVIGYGVEGNIIGSSLVDYLLSKSKEYYVYPSVHKSNEHMEREKFLWDDYHHYNNVAIICDIMPPEDYMKEIIESSSKLNNCSTISFISLFCNMNLLKKDTGYIKGKAIKKFSLARVDVEVCDKIEEDCFICTQNLAKVYHL